MYAQLDTSQSWAGRIWDSINQGIARLSVTQTATLSGTASAGSIISVTTHDLLNGWLQTGALALGLIGGALSVVLVCMKWVQQRREMRHWTHQNPGE